MLSQVAAPALPTPTGPVARRHAVTVTGRPGGEPVVLLHGFACDQTMWRRSAGHFAVDRPVVLLDQVGAGRSDLSAYDPRRHRSLRGYAADLVELLDELDLGPAAVVGHSAGGMTALLASIERPDLVSAVVLVGGSPRYLDDPAGGYVGGFTREDVDGLLEAVESNYLGWSRALAPVAMGNADRPELAEELATTFARAERRIAADHARAIFLSDHRADLARVTVPTLVVQTLQDPMVPEPVGRYLHDHLPGSAYALLSATGHFPHVSGPDETAGVVRAFLDGCAARGAA